MKNSYAFSILRYKYDGVSQEFVNVGVVVYSTNPFYFSGKFLKKSSRVSKMFGRKVGLEIKPLLETVKLKVEEFSKLNNSLNITEILNRIIPKDDNSLQFSEISSGITDDLDNTVEDLFTRYVDLYEQKDEKIHRRTEKDIWNTFKNTLEDKNINFVKKTINTGKVELNYDHAYKNGIWHICKPVSFDMEIGIKEKAMNLLGEGSLLNKSSENLRLYMLVAKPEDQTLDSEFRTALDILEDIPAEKTIYLESETEKFANDFENYIKNS